MCGMCMRYAGCYILYVGCRRRYVGYCNLYVDCCSLYGGCGDTMWSIIASMVASKGALYGLLKTKKNNKSPDSVSVQDFQVEAKNREKQFTRFPTNIYPISETPQELRKKFQ